MILNQNFLHDNRVEQEYKSLEKAGYRVIVVANHDGIDSNEFEIIRIKHRTVFSKYLNIFFCPNPFLAKRIINKLKEIGIQKIDAVHVHDLIWAFLGFQLKKFFKSKIVIDLHENYPAWSQDIFVYQSIINKISKLIKSAAKSIIKYNDMPFYINVSKIVRTPEKFKKYETKVLNKCDSFICVVDEGLDNFKNELYYNKGIVVSNTKSPEEWKFTELPPITNKIILSYMGSVFKWRGLDVAIKAMKFINPDEFEFYIVGINEKNFFYKKYSELIKHNNIKNVNLVGHFDDEQEEIGRAHV